jgi:hypothetical protein
MLIREFAMDQSRDLQLMALARFFAERARDQAVEPRISRAAFINMAAGLGISITPDQLKDMSQREPLKSMIQNVTGDDQGHQGEVIFRGSTADSESDQDQAEMTPDQAQQTVDAMSKRAALKDL